MTDQETLMEIKKVLERIDERVKTIVESHQKMVQRLNRVEATAPYALKIVDQSLTALNKLTDHITKMEQDNLLMNRKISGWGKWISWASDMTFKLIWVVIAAYLLAKLGLNDSMLQFPF